MSNKNLLIIFVKNVRLGNVKTRLAQSIGNEAAFEVYKHLVEITEVETERMRNCDIHVYFSDVIITTKWKSHLKFVQIEGDLGAKMKNAFENGFKMGYTSAVGIGSDLPDLRSSIIEQAFEKLNNAPIVFGPATDGGYYLIGMNSLFPFVFENKPWSTDELLSVTLNELHQQALKVELLEKMNDIDTLNDLKTSSLKELFGYLLK